MSSERTTIWESAVLLVLCSITALGSLGVIVWAVVAGQLLSLDGLLLTTTCLVFALFFGGNVLWSFRTGEGHQILKSLLKPPEDSGK